MTFPNYLTVFRMFLTPVLAATLISDKNDWSLYIFVLACLTDWYDGYYARKNNIVTTVGKILDPLADKLLVLTVFGVFVDKGYLPFWMFMLIVVRDVFITILRQYSIATNRPLKTSKLAKWKTFSQMTAIYLILIGINASKNYEELALVQWTANVVTEYHLTKFLMIFVTAFTVLTGLTYLKDNRRILKRLIIAFYRVFVPTNVR